MAGLLEFFIETFWLWFVFVILGCIIGVPIGCYVHRQNKIQNVGGIKIMEDDEWRREVLARGYAEYFITNGEAVLRWKAQ